MTEQEKKPMLIEMEIIVPIEEKVEKVFELIKKIDELRNPSHEIRLKISGCAI